MSKHPYDIVAYTYKADEYTPKDLAARLASDGFPVAREVDNANAAEIMLDELAELQGIDRMDERTFDSGDFPKVIFRNQVGS